MPKPDTVARLISRASLRLSTPPESPFGQLHCGVSRNTSMRPCSCRPGSPRPRKNGTGDDPIKPLGKIELLDRYTEAPGPGVEEGTTWRAETNTLFARIDVLLSAHAAMGAELPNGDSGGVDKRSDAREPNRRDQFGFGNVLGQAWIVHDFDQRWAMALGGQLIAPTSTNGVATDAWEQVTGFVVRAMLPEISPSMAISAPQVRYGIDFEGNDDGRMLRQLRIAPTLNIKLPHNLFFYTLPKPRTFD